VRRHENKYDLLLRDHLGCAFSGERLPQQSADKSKQSHKTQGPAFPLFHPDGMAKPTAGYYRSLKLLAEKMVLTLLRAGRN